MDMMQIKTKLMRGIVGKLLKKAIKNKTGCNVDLDINDIDIAILDDGTARIHLDINGLIEAEDVKKLVKTFDLL